MSDGELDLARQSRQWALAIVSAIKTMIDDDVTPFSVEFQNADAEAIQKEVHIRSSVHGDPSLVIMVEESQAFLSIDRVPGISVLYEFNDSPETLSMLLGQSKDSMSEATHRSLSEVDLIHHVIAFTKSGYTFSRVPLFERLRIGGFGSTPELEWSNVDLAWPLFMFSSWKPSSR